MMICENKNMLSRKNEVSGQILFVVLVVAVAAELVGHAVAATYVVGDSLGWTVPPGGASTYENWASQHVFRIGDVLVFNFTTGTHNVIEVGTENFYDKCIAPPWFLRSLPALMKRPEHFILNSTGNHYYFCAEHCSLGQKLAITVIGNSSTGIAPAPLTLSPPALSNRDLNSPSPPSSAPMVLTVGSCKVLIFASIFVMGIFLI